MAWTKWRETMVKRASVTWALVSRPMVLGVRILASDGDGRIVLVRHGYLPGWYLPGGAVDPGETAASGALRELHEETGCRPDSTPELVGLYLNDAVSRRDHIAFYRLPRTLRPDTSPAAGFEIAEIGWFSPDALPDGTTDATRRRITEVFGGVAISDRW